jgi:hypothetical protein
MITFLVYNSRRHNYYKQVPLFQCTKSFEIYVHDKEVLTVKEVRNESIEMKDKLKYFQRME